MYCVHNNIVCAHNLFPSVRRLLFVCFGSVKMNILRAAGVFLPKAIALQNVKIFKNSLKYNLKRCSRNVSYKP